jgi:hypothetical protein
VYEDDYMAVGKPTHFIFYLFAIMELNPLSSSVVNKPSGMICHSLSKGGFDSNSVLRYEV